MTITLYGFWRSLATYRVRAALNLKGLAYTEISVDLLKGEQFLPAFHRLNPQQVLPVIDHDGLRLVQSMPIVEYLDEVFPQVPLLPADAAGRARVRALAQIATADVHPLVVPRVRQRLAAEFNASEAQQLQWARHWFDRGSAAIESHLAGEAGSGPFAHGDAVTLADLALVSHVVGARLFQADLSRAPRLEALADHCLAMEAFARAHPMRQTGAPPPAA
jgi:maleylacetoacetate isomerase